MSSFLGYNDMSQGLPCADCIRVGETSMQVYVESISDMVHEGRIIFSKVCWEFWKLDLHGVPESADVPASGRQSALTNQYDSHLLTQ